MASGAVAELVRLWLDIRRPRLLAGCHPAVPNFRFHPHAKQRTRDGDPFGRRKRGNSRRRANKTVFLSRTTGASVVDKHSHVSNPYMTPKENQDR